MKQDDVISGFRITRISGLAEIDSVVVEAEHLVTGARFMHVSNKDTENLFSINFPTQPDDETGVPHILEHSVLAGSEKYPVREPFFEMVKMSMATFINAMTATEYTMYPVSSCVQQDLFNLASVYVDAVFHPLLTEMTFRREGHHLAFARPGDVSSPLEINGIVYNEMKAVFARGDYTVYMESQKRLFPDIPLCRNSGGDPEAIPELSYQQFRKFHEKLYHPSNAFFFTHGDIPTERYLSFIDTALAGYSRMPVVRNYPFPAKWTAPRSVQIKYPAGTDDLEKAGAYLTLQWIVGDGMDPALDMAWQALSLILTGNDSALLKKAIIDSGIGKDLFATSMFRDGNVLGFRVGVKGSSVERSGEFETLVLEKLREISLKGITREMVDSAFRQLSYFREIDRHFILRMMDQVLPAWHHDQDPLVWLGTGDLIRECRKKYNADPGFFGKIIERDLLKNGHRLLLAASPDPGYQSTQKEVVARKLAEKKSLMTGKELERIKKEVEEVQRFNSASPSPEALAVLPRLKLKDLPSEPENIPFTVEKAGPGLVLLRSGMATNGIAYLTLDIDVPDLPWDLYPFIPHFSEVYNKMGTVGKSFTNIAERKAAWFKWTQFNYAFQRHAVDPSLRLARLRFVMVAAEEGLEEALSLFDDLTTQLDPGDLDRLAVVMKQCKNERYEKLPNNGAYPAMVQARRTLSPELEIEYRMNGLPALRRSSEFAADPIAAAEGFIRQIEGLKDQMRKSERRTASFIGSDKAFEKVGSYLKTRFASGSGIRRPQAQYPHTNTPPTRDGLLLPVQNSHAVFTMPAMPPSHPDQAILRLACNVLTHDLWLPEVRLKNNAYGAGVRYDGNHSLLEFSTYADPLPARTWDVFQGVGDYLRKLDIPQGELEKSIIGTVREFFRPIRPPEAMTMIPDRYYSGEDPEVRKAQYQRMMNCTSSELKRVLLDQWEQHSHQMCYGVVADKSTLETVQKSVPDIVVTDVFNGGNK